MLSGEDEQRIGKEIKELKDRLGSLKQRLKEEPEVLLNGEIALLERRQTDTKQTMITSNLRLVVSIAKSYQHRGLGCSI